jgi:hypothetical protein
MHFLAHSACVADIPFAAHFMSLTQPLTVVVSFATATMARIRAKVHIIRINFFIANPPHAPANAANEQDVTRARLD